MKEQEPPIHHRRDPKLSPIEIGYKRTRPPINHGWIPELQAPNSDLFPWKLGTVRDGEHPAAEPNPDFLATVDEATTTQVYGDWQPDKNLSDDGRMYLATIDYVFDNLSTELVNTDGEIPETLLFAGYPLKEFLTMIDDAIKDKREHRYIMEQFGRALDEFTQTWRKVAAERPVSTQEQTDTSSYTHPIKQFHQDALSAAFAVQLARHAPLVKDDPIQEEPEPHVVDSIPLPSQQLIERIESRNFSPPKPTITTDASQTPDKAVERRVPTDIIKEDLVAQGLIEKDDVLKPIVLVTMRRIRDAALDSSNEANLYQMVNSMKLDVGINANDIKILNLFTTRLIQKK
ncbi:hypothetical protein EPN95_03820 [Patescibacteria group bacterium]|nr:MAG: hypothetical protein EPN95_03820 [Patescibacteria group bacterium]